MESAAGPSFVLHEIETWVLAARSQLADHVGSASLAKKLDRIVSDAGGPELVDDGPATSPSRRLLDLCRSYAKLQDGPEALQRAGLDVVLDQCPRAARWLGSLRAGVEGHG